MGAQMKTVPQGFFGAPGLSCFFGQVPDHMFDCTFEIGVESHDKLYRNPFLNPLAPHELKADIATPRDAATPEDSD